MPHIKITDIIDRLRENTQYIYAHCFVDKQVTNDINEAKLMRFRKMSDEMLDDLIRLQGEIEKEIK